MRLRQRGRRPRRQDRGKHGRGQTDVHGSRAADLREGVSHGSSRRKIRGRPQSQAVRHGIRGRDKRSTVAAVTGKSVPHLALHRVCLTGWYSARSGTVRRADPVLRVRLRAAQPRDRGVVPRRGPADPGGYGLTESGGAGFINRPNNYRLGTVGLPFEGTEVRISDAGEIQIRSASVMDGYHHLPEGHRGNVQRRRLAASGDQGSSTTTASCRSPAGSRNCLSCPTANTSRRRRSRQSSRRCARTPASSWCSARGAISLPPS